MSNTMDTGPSEGAMESITRGEPSATISTSPGTRCFTNAPSACWTMTSIERVAVSCAGPDAGAYETASAASTVKNGFIAWTAQRVP